jgi:RNA polymerase subunit RPABC4/transcription elongation factor Spt4
MKSRFYPRLLVVYFVVVAVVLATLWMAMARGHVLIRVSHGDPVAAAILPFALSFAVAIGLFFLFLAIAIGYYVYHDARARGMEPILWTLVAVFVPYFVGLVIYLIAREQNKATCPSCGTRSPVSTTFCPRCGKAMQTLCASCKRPLPTDAHFCPQCGGQVQVGG